MIVALLLVCYAYFEACKMVGMFIAWSFLVGFPFAFPFTFLAALDVAAEAAALGRCWRSRRFLECSGVCCLEGE